MSQQDLPYRLAALDRKLRIASTPGDVWRALQDLSAGLVGFRLFTMMTVDLANDLARRSYTSHPAEYPVSGTKPMQRDAWFDIVHGQQRPFVANTIADIAKVFPDHETIRSLDCGSVVNLPVVVGGRLAATINLLHAEHYYGVNRIDLIVRYLTQPARRAFDAAGAPI
ncbi:MAG: GAF domain-containing protein [Rhizobiales bacterium]|nr:GAF domain-containing protein [Hyphomicrobiales bacterium]MBI3672314.1 GAF domain-containing protein [Hyphomicrobiales bacterium]